MPFTHVDTEKPKPSNKRRAEFPEPLRSPPALRRAPSPIESSSSNTPTILRLKPNPYAAEQMATVPPPQPPRVAPLSPTTSTNYGRESLPPIRDIVPELSSLGTQPPPASSQDYGPESFQPSGPSIRPAASGLAPSPRISVRVTPFSTTASSPRTPSYSERQFTTSSAPISRSSASRNSPTQPLSGSLPLRSESVRSLPPLSAAYGSPESGRPSGYISQQGSSHPQPSSHWQTQQSSYHPSGVPIPAQSPYSSAPGPHGLQNSPPYAHYDNSDYNSDGKSKRRRGNLPKQVTDTLRKWFNEHTAHPYPTEDEKVMLMNATHLTMSQISNWFINARRRSVPQQQAQQAQQQQANPRDGAGAGGVDGREGPMPPMGYMPDRGGI